MIIMVFVVSVDYILLHAPSLNESKWLSFLNFELHRNNGGHTFCSDICEESPSPQLSQGGYTNNQPLLLAIDTTNTLLPHYLLLPIFMFLQIAHYGDHDEDQYLSYLLSMMVRIIVYRVYILLFSLYTVVVSSLNQYRLCLFVVVAVALLYWYVSLSYYYQIDYTMLIVDCVASSLVCGVIVAVQRYMYWSFNNTWDLQMTSRQPL